MTLFGLRIIQSTKVQLLAILLTTLYAAGLLIWQYQYYRALELTPIIHPISEGLPSANNVEIGLHINSFPIFSFIKNEFVLDGSVWFRYNDKEIDQKIIEQFTFQNALSENGELLYKSAPIIKQKDNKTTIIYHIQSALKAALNHGLFPTGDHTLNIVLQNKTATPTELTFISGQKNCTLAEDLLVRNWYPRSTTVTTGYMEAPMQQDNPSFTQQYPSTIFSIDFQNMALRDVISLYFPLFVLFLIGLLSLTIDVFEVTRLNLIIAAVPILVLFRMVIDAQAPSVGYSMQVDHIYHLLVFLSLLILFFQMYVTLSTQEIKEKSEAYQEEIKTHLEVLNSIVLFTALFLLVICMTYLSYIIL
jgi:hypothetical protein